MWNGWWCVYSRVDPCGQPVDAAVLAMRLSWICDCSGYAAILVMRLSWIYGYPGDAAILVMGLFWICGWIGNAVAPTTWPPWRCGRIEAKVLHKRITFHLCPWRGLVLYWNNQERS